MNTAEPNKPHAASASAPDLPAQTSLDSLAASAETTVDVTAPRGCPFLLAENGDWRLDIPTRDHRCAAVSPPAALSVEKQARLCLTASHTGCATYLASISARGTRLGTPLTDRSTRWGLARTTTVIEDAGGLRSRIAGLVLDRRRWPAIPALILVATLLTLAVSGLQGGSTPGPSPSPSRPAPTPALTARPSVAPSRSAAPEPTPTEAPSAAPSPTVATTTGPAETFRTYRVQSGDTLSAIASKFGTTSREIAQLNGIKVSTTLHAGDILKIPN